jgi:hypothetical protein
MPNCSSFEGTPVVDPTVETLSDNLGYQVHWHVPIDDYSHWKYIILFRYSGRMDREYQKRQHSNIDTAYRTMGTHANRFLQDREEMRSKSYAGLGRRYYDHDRFATESQGAIADRTQEHLGASDKPILAMRRQMVKAIQDVQEGRAPLRAERAVPDPLDSMIVRCGKVAPSVNLEEQWWESAVS